MKNNLSIVQLPNKKIYIYLIDTETNTFVDKTFILKEYIYRPDIVCATINKLIQRNGGIKVSNKIRMSPNKLSSADSIIKWQLKNKV